MKVNKVSIFEITTGPVDHGWCDFTVRLGDGVWNCHSSYIGSHPLHALIHSAIDLYNHIFEDPIPVENAIWDSLAADEPGGIVIRATPKIENVRVQIYQYLDDPLYPSPKAPEIPPAADAEIDYWTYADAIFLDASRAIARQGITGFRNAWEPNRWDIDAHCQVLPIEHFLYLAALVKHRAPIKGLRLEEEIAILTELGERHTKDN